MIQIIEDRTQWNALLASCCIADFYHSYDFHTLDKKAGEKAILIHYKDNGLTVLLPLLLREIEGTPYLDATSVYGYAGPLWCGSFTLEQARRFQQVLQKSLEEMNIVSLFSRLHPYLPKQRELLTGMGEIETLGKVVNIDVTLSPEVQWSHISKRFRSYINKARRLYVVREGKSQEDLLVFIRLYEDTMRRLDAKSNYFFNKDYYEGLFRNEAFETTVLLAEDPNTGKVISGAMFISSGDMVQYHLSGTDSDYMKLHPVKLLIDEMRVRATAQGKRYFNLGGGLGGSEDSLFEFKSRFSKDFRDFEVWKYISNPEIYKSLSVNRLPADCKKDFNTCKHFFPCYRCAHHKP